MNVSEVIFRRLVQWGARDVFTVTGGFIMHLTDALACTPGVSYWCTYHEQAAAIAAESYARLCGRLGVCLVTAGPGATNALSGIVSAYMDSAPVLVLSGQVRTDLIADHSRWRQLGPQEVNATAMAAPVTKATFSLRDGSRPVAVIDEAVRVALGGRPGPVWVEIPLDVQGEEVVGGEDLLAALPFQPPPPTCPRADLRRVLTEIRAATRPVVVCGKGVRLADAVAQLDTVVRHLGLPVVTTIGGMDVLPEDHPYSFGRFGPTGQRRANFIVQNADLLLCLGTGMAVAAIGFDTSGFAPRAKRVMVNVDAGELQKPHFRPDVAVQADLGSFLRGLLELPEGEMRQPQRGEWLRACRSLKSRYDLVTPEYLADEDHVNSYYLAHALSRRLAPDDVVITGNSLDAHSVFHSFAVKQGQRVYTNTNYGAMGWDLPALVGACVGSGSGRVVLVTGDGSIQFNVHELMTIGGHSLNARIFVLNNGGYQAIRATQGAFCEGRLTGSDVASGVYNPRFADLAAAYGLRYEHIHTNKDVDMRLPDILDRPGPLLCEVAVAYDQERLPRVMARRLEDGTLRSGSLEDQYPFLPPGEVAEIMRGNGVRPGPATGKPSPEHD